MLLRRKQLSENTQERLMQILEHSDLPDLIPIPDGITLQNLGNTGSSMDRFNDGKFSISIGKEELILDGGVDETGFVVKWDIRIESESGHIIATPGFVSKISKFYKDRLKTIPGFEPRMVGSLGRLVPLFPIHIDWLLRQFMHKTVYATVSDVESFRIQLRGEI